MAAKLLNGTSAYRLLKMERWLAVAGWVTFALGIFVLWLGSTSVPGLLPVGVVAFVASALAVSLSNASLLSLARQRAEESAGYTTIPEPHRPDIDLVDPTTGEVIRARGEPAISRETFEARVKNSNPYPGLHP
jgi:hypothetical protein